MLNPQEFTSPVLPKNSSPELITAIEDATRQIFDLHGASAFEASRDAAIAHEVGHAIIGTHEGFKIRQISIYSQAVPNFGLVWGGRCIETAKFWTCGPDTSADDDLRRARFIIAGLAGEAITGRDKPGSSLDELVLSQLVGLNAAKKLDGYIPTEAYAHQFWNEKVWYVGVAILRANRRLFSQLGNHLHQHEQVKGGKLRDVLAQVGKVTP
jgi:hypothetical protein